MGGTFPPRSLPHLHPALPPLTHTSRSPPGTNSACASPQNTFPPQPPPFPVPGGLFFILSACEPHLYPILAVEAVGAVVVAVKPEAHCTGLSWICGGEVIQSTWLLPLPLHSQPPPPWVPPLPWVPPPPTSPPTLLRADPAPPHALLPLGVFPSLTSPYYSLTFFLPVRVGN